MQRGEGNFLTLPSVLFLSFHGTHGPGYGDISSKGTPQRLFGIFAMVIGALLFGYGVSNVVNIVEELRASERIFREKMDKFNQ